MHTWKWYLKQWHLRDLFALLHRLAKNVIWLRFESDKIAISRSEVDFTHSGFLLNGALGGEVGV